MILPLLLFIGSFVHSDSATKPLLTPYFRKAETLGKFSKTHGKPFEVEYVFPKAQQQTA